MKPTKKIDDDDIKFDFQEFMRIYQLEKYAAASKETSSKGNLDFLVNSNPAQQPIDKTKENVQSNDP